MNFIADDLAPLLALLLRRLKSGPLRLLITSAWSGEGKSTVTWTLGHCVAESHSSPTLLVDGDLRKPTLSYRMELLGKGIANLAGPDTDVAPTFLGGGLLGVGAGHVEGEVTKVLHSIVSGGQLTTLLGNYNFVLVDSPPLTVCDDAFVLSEACSGVLLVVSQVKYRGAEHLCLNRFRESGIPVMGVVLTHAEGKRSNLGGILSSLGLRS